MEDNLRGTLMKRQEEPRVVSLLRARGFGVYEFSPEISGAFGVQYARAHLRSREGTWDGWLYDRRDFRRRVEASIRWARKATRIQEQDNRASWSSRSRSREAKWRRLYGRLILSILRDLQADVLEVQRLGFDGLGLPRQSCRFLGCGKILRGRGPREVCDDHRDEDRRLAAQERKRKSRKDLSQKGSPPKPPLGTSNLQEYMARREDGSPDFETEARVSRKEVRRLLRKGR